MTTTLAIVRTQKIWIFRLEFNKGRPMSSPTLSEEPSSSVIRRLFVSLPNCGSLLQPRICIIHCCLKAIFQGRKETNPKQRHWIIYLSLEPFLVHFTNLFSFFFFHHIFFIFIYFTFSSSRIRLDKKTGFYKAYTTAHGWLVFFFLHSHINLALLFRSVSLMKRMALGKPIQQPKQRFGSYDNRIFTRDTWLGTGFFYRSRAILGGIL